MLKISCFLQLWIPLFIFGCESPKKEEVTLAKHLQIDPKAHSQYDLPELTLQSIIPLETTDSSLIAFMMNIEYFSDHFYILNLVPPRSRKLLAFSGEGKYIRKTSQGKGPGEHVFVANFFVDKNTKRVLLMDHVVGQFTYDLDLHFLSHKKLDRMFLLDFAVLKNKDILARSHEYGDYTYRIYTPDWGEVKKEFVSKIEYEGAVGLFSSISTYDRTLFISPYDYNIYEWKGDTAESLLYLDFGRYNSTKEEIETFGLPKLREMRNKGERVSGPTGIAESESFLSFHVYLDEPKYYLYSKAPEKVYLLNDYFERGTIPNCQIGGVISDDTFYAVVKPDELMAYQEQFSGTAFDEIEVSENDNPYIITFSISE